MLEPDELKILKFCMLQIAGKHNFQPKLRYLEASKQANLRMKTVP